MAIAMAIVMVMVIELATLLRHRYQEKIVLIAVSGGDPEHARVASTFARHTLHTGESYAAPSTVQQRQDIADVEAYNWRIERIVLPDGRYGVVCYFYDLSERQRWENQLRESEERFRVMADRVPLIVWVHDVDGKLVFINEA
jgi:PAS domain-containing protein